MPTAPKVLLFTALLLIPLQVTIFPQSGNSQRRNQTRPTAPPDLQLPGPGSSPRESNRKETPEETLKIESNLVTVVTSIKASEGTNTSKLAQTDFSIFEDGVEQEISYFTREEDLPLRLVMLFDTSSSVKNQMRFERRAAAKFFESLMRPQDQAALFSVSTDITVIQDFTNKPKQLTEATKLLQAKGATSLYDAIYLAAGYLKLTKGRRIIVIVSDGGDTTSQKSLSEALEQAQLADVMIFNVFTGLISSSQNIRDLAAERAMQTLTMQTGGEVYTPRMQSNSNELDEDQSLKSLDAAFAQLADQLRTQYTLRFYSTNDNRDGKFRKLQVQVKQPGLTAKARAGYYAPKN